MTAEYPYVVFIHIDQILLLNKNDAEQFPEDRVTQIIYRCPHSGQLKEYFVIDLYKTSRALYLLFTNNIKIGFYTETYLPPSFYYPLFVKLFGLHHAWLNDTYFVNAHYAYYSSMVHNVSYYVANLLRISMDVRFVERQQNPDDKIESYNIWGFLKTRFGIYDQIIFSKPPPKLPLLQSSDADEFQERKLKCIDKAGRTRQGPNKPGS